jgi:diguanylate cyclase (GGDEF)-like protein
MSSTPNEQAELKDAVQQLHEYQIFEKCSVPAGDSQALLQIMETVRDFFADKFVFDRLTVFIKLPNEKFCVMHDVVGQDDIVPFPAGTLMRLKGSGAEFVMNQKRAHYNPDIQSYKQFVDDEQLAHGGIRTLVRIPLMHDEEAFGVMSVNSIKDKHFSRGEVPLMERLAKWLSRSAYSLSLAFGIQSASYKDMLTGAYNRSFLNDLIISPKSGIAETIAGVSAEAAEVSVLFVDIKRFKQFNDRFGYSEGDIRLARLVKLLEEVATDEGFVTRFTGGRFLVVFPGKSKLEAERLKNDLELRALTFNAMYGDSPAEKKPLSLQIQLATGSWTNFEKLVNSLTESLDESHSL